jgi:FKBP-type peptidyl-prolyl cis-trans isomerase
MSARYRGINLLALGLLPACSPERNNQTSHTYHTRKETMTATPSGLKYSVMRPAQRADAKAPQAGKTVKVHYTGWLADSEGNPRLEGKFDSSIDRNTPFTFVIGQGQVIKGWDEGVMSMRVGEKRRLVIPPHLGYGARGAGGMIPPNATLVFDVELLDVE